MSVSGLSGGNSPLQRLQGQLTSSISSGKVKAEDQDALSAALTSIDSSLSAGRLSGGKGSRPDPSQIKSKIDGLVDDQVKAGTLTDDQASELKGILADAAPKGGGKSGHAHGAGGPPPGGQAPDGQAQDATSSASSTSDILAEFLKQLQEQQPKTYGASGTSQTSAAASSLVVDYQA